MVDRGARGAKATTKIHFLLTKNEMADDGDILAGLRPNYLARLEARVADLRTFAAALEKGTLDAQQHIELHRLTHSMASSAAIFGHAGLSAAANAAEKVVDASSASIDQQCLALSRLVEEAGRVLATAA